MQPGGGPQTLRLMNCAAVLTVLREAGKARVTELMRATGLSRPTVTAAVSTLIDDGLVEETETLEADVPRMGRPARVLRFRADARYVLGVDVGPHRIYCEVADLNGTIVARQRRDLTAEGDAHANLLAGVEATMIDVLAKAAVPATELAAVGVGTPGIVDTRRGAAVQAPSMPGRDLLELGRLLQRNVRCPVHVENDVNLAVMAERWRGAGSQANNLLLVQWGSRVGAAVLLQDQLLRGAHDAAGEIGFVDLEEEPQGGCRPTDTGRSSPLSGPRGSSAVPAASAMTGAPTPRLSSPRRPAATREPSRWSTRPALSWRVASRLSCWPSTPNSSSSAVSSSWQATPS
jgi:DNA-binding transcriptional ArsR family regulator